VTSGLEVKIADLDPQQGTSVKWSLRRQAAGIEPVVPVESFGKVAQALAVAGRYDLLVMDGPARSDAGTLEIAKAAALVVQPSGTSVDDLEPAVILFRELEKRNVSRSKLAIALCRAGTEAEEAQARGYVAQAGFSVLPGCLFERPAYRQAQNDGLAVTETRFSGLSKRADELIQAIVDRL
jgi:chromosome partitioning protein